jgi:hypothetical protein
LLSGLAITLALAAPSPYKEAAREPRHHEYQFRFPAHKQELFYSSVAGIAQFAPWFAGRYE